MKIKGLLAFLLTGTLLVQNVGYIAAKELPMETVDVLLEEEIADEVSQDIFQEAGTDAAEAILDENAAGTGADDAEAEIAQSDSMESITEAVADTTNAVAENESDTTSKTEETFAADEEIELDLSALVIEESVDAGISYLEEEVIESEETYVYEDGETSYTYIVVDGCATLTKYTGSAPALTIPAEVVNGEEKYQVTAIGESLFSKHTELTQVTIPNSVTDIGERAFANCSKLTTLLIPDSVTKIGEYAFAWCDSLTDVTLGTGVTTIEDYAFFNCSNLINLSVNSTIFDRADNKASSVSSNSFQAAGLENLSLGAGVAGIAAVLTNFETLKQITVDEGNQTYTAVDGVLFNKEMTILYRYPQAKEEINYTIPETVQIIGEKAFYNNEKLQSVTMGNAVATIGNYAFNTCKGLSKVTFSSALTEIGNFAFSSCTSLEEIVIPDNATILNTSAFEKCSKLSRVTLGTGVTKLGTSAFANCTNLKYLALNSTILWTGATVFSGVNLQTLVIGKNVTDIPRDILAMSSLGTITAAEGNEAYSLKDGVLFSTDKKVLKIYPASKADASYTIPETVTEIADKAFYNNTNLTSLTLPSGLEKIGAYAFAGCTNLSNLMVQNNVAAIDECAFLNSSLTQVTLGEGVTEIHREILDISTLQSFEAEEGNASFSAQDGVLLRADGKVIHRYPRGKGESSTYSVPETVTGISAYAFKDTLVEKILIPGTLCSVGEYAFYHCASVSGEVKFSGAYKIGTYAFAECDGITSLVLDGTAESTESADFEMAFESSDLECDYTEDGSTENSSGSESSNNSARRIGDFAFHNCDFLTSAEFSGAAPTMKSNAFMGVTAIFYYDKDGIGWTDVLNTFGSRNICMMEKGNCDRAIAVLLDCSGSMNGAPLAALKTAATEFCATVLDSQAATQIVLIQYEQSAYSYGFTSNQTGLQKAISGLRSDGSTDFNEAITKADCYLKAISASEKNMVIMTDALPQYGTYSETGPYDSTDHSTYYRYANAVCNLCDTLDTRYRIFTMGFFHSLEEDEKDFAADLLDRIQNCGYYEVTELDKLTSSFGSIAGAIVNPGETETENEKPTESETGSEKPTETETEKTPQPDISKPVETEKPAETTKPVETEKPATTMPPSEKDPGQTESTIQKETEKPVSTGKKQTIKASNLVISDGKTKTIKAAAKTKLTYRSSDSSIAKVTSKGVVKGLKPGKAVITIRASASKKYASAKKTITVTVTAVKNKTYKVGSYKYKVTNTTRGSGAVTLTSAAKSRIKKVTVPSTVKIGTVTYKVTAIGSSAFAKNTSLKEVTIGKNVKSIGSKAFYNCKKLSKMTISSSKITSVGSNSFKGVSSKAKIKVPSRKKAAYKKLFRKRGLSSKVKIY